MNLSPQRLASRWLKVQVCALACISLSLFAPAPSARAGAGTDISEFLSNTGNIAYLVAGVGLPLLEDGAQGKNHALRSLDAVGTTVILTEGLKFVVHEERPDHSDNDSFPSGHASAAFSIATTESAFHPRQAPFWFAGAALIGASRVALHRHYIHDVVAGAALGYGISRLELGRRHGILLFPFIEPDQGAGLRIAARF